jgi:hypothetical protein
MHKLQHPLFLIKRVCILAVSPGFQFSPGDKLQGSGIDTIPQAGGGRPIVKQVPQVRIAVFAPYLGSDHEQAPVLVLYDVVGIERFCKTGPARPGFIFIPGAEKRFPGYNVHIDAIVFFVPVFVFKGWFGAILTRNFILQWG